MIAKASISLVQAEKANKDIFAPSAATGQIDRVVDVPIGGHPSIHRVRLASFVSVARDEYGVKGRRKRWTLRISLPQSPASFDVEIVRLRDEL